MVAYWNCILFLCSCCVSLILRDPYSVALVSLHWKKQSSLLVFTTLLLQGKPFTSQPRVSGSRGASWWGPQVGGPAARFYGQVGLVPWSIRGYIIFKNFLKSIYSYHPSKQRLFVVVFKWLLLFPIKGIRKCLVEYKV